MGTVRNLPRFFFTSRDLNERSLELLQVGESFFIPDEEYRKLTRVLRLAKGDHFAALPNDGRLLVCELNGREALIREEHYPQTELKRQIWIAQALPKGDKLETIVRFGTQLGASGFIIFESDRSLVKWDIKKRTNRFERLGTIVREEAEVSFRTHLADLKWAENLDDLLLSHPNAIVLSECESEKNRLQSGMNANIILVAGPEGGWSPRELSIIGDRGCTLGPRVLRVEFAAAAALSALVIPN